MLRKELEQIDREIEAEVNRIAKQMGIDGLILAAIKGAINNVWNKYVELFESVPAEIPVIQKIMETIDKQLEITLHGSTLNMKWRLGRRNAYLEMKKYLENNFSVQVLEENNRKENTFASLDEYTKKYFPESDIVVCKKAVKQIVEDFARQQEKKLIMEGMK